MLLPGEKGKNRFVHKERKISMEEPTELLVEEIGHIDPRGILQMVPRCPSALSLKVWTDSLKCVKSPDCDEVVLVYELR